MASCSKCGKPVSAGEWRCAHCRAELSAFTARLSRRPATVSPAAVQGGQQAAGGGTRSPTAFVRPLGPRPAGPLGRPGAPAAASTPGSRSLGRTLVTWALLLAPFSWGGYNVSRSVPCAEAIADVEGHHGVTFGAMQAVLGDVSVECPGIELGTLVAAERSVSVRWVYRGEPYEALYHIDPERQITPGNGLAVQVDQAASSGANLLSRLAP